MWSTSSLRPNIRLGCKYLKVTNATAYFAPEWMTNKKVLLQWLLYSYFPIICLSSFLPMAFVSILEEENFGQIASWPNWVLAKIIAIIELKEKNWPNCQLSKLNFDQNYGSNWTIDISKIYRLLKFCYVLTTCAAYSKGIFAAATNSTNQTNKAGRMPH